MTDAVALLAAIRQAPDDDAPRLVYADWLDEHGQAERAKFIRVQCELARTDRFDSRWFDLDNRARSMISQYYAQWKAPLQPLKVQGDFHRGFVDPMYIPITTYIDRHAELTAMEPAVHVRFSVTPAVNLRKRGEQPAIESLRGVSFQDSFVKWDRIKDFLASPHLTRLERLILGRAGLDSAGLPDFLGLTTLPNLSDLSLAENSIGDGVRHFANPRHRSMVSRLVRLDLAGCEIGPGTAGGLREAPFESIHVLRLDGNDLAEELPDAFGEWAVHLRELSLSTPLSDSAFERLLRPGRFHDLEVLRLRGCGSYTASRLAVLADPSRLPGLSELQLHDLFAFDPTPAATEDIRRFLESPVANRLLRLTVPVEPVWAEAFAACQAGRGLRHLILNPPGSAGIRSEDLRSILCSTGLNEVRELEMWEVARAEGVLREVAASPYLPALKRINAGHRSHFSKETISAWEQRCGPDVWC